MTNDFPHHSIPTLIHDRDSESSGREVLTLTVGSDLILEARHYEDTKGGRSSLRVEAYDSSGNYLATLAVSHRVGNGATQMMELAVPTALRLFPGYLTAERT